MPDATVVVPVNAFEPESVSVPVPVLRRLIAPASPGAYVRLPAEVSKPKVAPDARLPVARIAPTAASSTPFVTASVAPLATENRPAVS